MLRENLKDPYFASDPDVVEDNYVGFAPGNDFNREIVEPGTNKMFPDGAVGVRIDDDFWVVAALPLDQYRDVPIQEIVKEFWPEVTKPVFKPDSGDPWWDRYHNGEFDTVEEGG